MSTFRILPCREADVELINGDRARIIESDIDPADAEFWTLYERHDDDGSPNANLEFAITDHATEGLAMLALDWAGGDYEGSRVRVVEDYWTRTPGDDNETPILVKAGCFGTVEGYVPDWFDADVTIDGGVVVWISPDNLEVL